MRATKWGLVQSSLVFGFVVLAAIGGFGFAQERIVSIHQGLVGGSTVDPTTQEEFGLLALSPGCSASLLNNNWAITAAHCVEAKDAAGNPMADPNRPGQNVLRPAAGFKLKAAWATAQDQNVTRIETFRPYDIAILKTAAPFTVKGKATGYSRIIFRDGQFPYFGTPVGADLMIFGRGINTFASGSGASAMPSSSDGLYRVAYARSNREDATVFWYPTKEGMMIAGGDSGGPSFAKVLDGYALVGVHSDTLASYVEGKSKVGWDWVTGTKEAADAPIKAVWGQISQVIAPPPMWQNWFRVTDGGGLKAPITAIQPRPGHVDLFVTGNDGYIYSTYHQADGGWRKWFRIGDLRVPREAKITALATRPDHIDLFVKGNLGRVYSTYFEPNGGWRPWFMIPGMGGRRPGGNIAAVQPRPGHIDLFSVGLDNKVMSTYFEAPGGWRPWFPIHDMTAAGFSEVTAHVTATKQIHLFVSGSEGGVYTSIFGTNSRWSNWGRIGGLVMKPGSPVTAIETSTGQIDLYAVAATGKVHSSYCPPTGRFTDWFKISNLESLPGTQVAALAPRPAHVDLFAVGVDGLVYSTYFDSAGGWRNRFRISNVTSTPGAAVTAQATRPDQIDLFVSGTDSGVYSTFFKN